MSTLDRMIDQHQPNRPWGTPWTEEEIQSWINKLPQKERELVLNTLKEAKRRNYRPDVPSNIPEHRRALVFACMLKRKIERLQLERDSKKLKWYEKVSSAAVGMYVGSEIIDKLYGKK